MERAERSARVGAECASGSGVGRSRGTARSGGDLCERGGVARVACASRIRNRNCDTVSKRFELAMIPEIVTDRLRLRGHAMDDFGASAAMWADPMVTRFIGGRPFSGEEAWARFLRYAGHWSYMGFGYWAMEERETGTFVGEVGFAENNRELQPSIHDIPELGWVLIPRVHGRGYATEAARAALDWGKTHLKSASTVCLIHPQNVASIRVAGKCGFAEYCRTTYKNEPTVLFARQL